MRLSENFSLLEFTESETASRQNLDNTPPVWAVENLAALAMFVLQPIRDQFGPVKILSGYRSDAVNNFVGGSQNSDHKFGYCADFTTPQADMKLVFEWIVNSGMRFHQLIDSIESQNMIHISYRHNGNQILFKNARGQYVVHPWARRDAYA